MAQEHIELLETLFEEQFGPLPASFVHSYAPGRVELAGNHTDHQGGHVISAAIDKCVHCLGARNSEKRIRIWMEGYGRAEIDLTEDNWRSPRAEETGTSAAIVRGMAAQLAETGATVNGADVVSCSDVPIGSGLSSSAAFELAVGLALYGLYAPDGGTWDDPTQLALAGVETERRFFGKPCGAQDQLASAHGGILAMDFSSYPPTAEHINFDASNCGYTIYVIDSGQDHAPFTQDFAQIINEMAGVSQAFNKEQLGSVVLDDFMEALPRLRKQLGDRACLRALHFFDEDRRVGLQRAALVSGDFEAFLNLAHLSGESSAQFLQNITPPSSDSSDQPALVVLGLCAHLLGRNGAWRIHGGGFGGGVLAIVPAKDAERFTTQMNAALGRDACLRINIGGPAASVERVSH